MAAVQHASKAINHKRYSQVKETDMEDLIKETTIEASVEEVMKKEEEEDRRSVGKNSSWVMHQPHTSW